MNMKAITHLVFRQTIGLQLDIGFNHLLVINIINRKLSQSVINFNTYMPK